MTEEQLVEIERRAKHGEPLSFDRWLDVDVPALIAEIRRLRTPDGILESLRALETDEARAWATKDVCTRCGSLDTLYCCYDPED